MLLEVLVDGQASLERESKDDVVEACSASLGSRSIERRKLGGGSLGNSVGGGLLSLRWEEVLYGLPVQRSLNLAAHLLTFSLLVLLSDRAEVVGPSLIPDCLRYDPRNSRLLCWLTWRVLDGDLLVGTLIADY